MIFMFSLLTVSKTTSRQRCEGCQAVADSLLLATTRWCCLWLPVYLKGQRWRIRETHCFDYLLTHTFAPKYEVWIMLWTLCSCFCFEDLWLQNKLIDVFFYNCKCGHFFSGQSLTTITIGARQLLFFFSNHGVCVNVCVSKLSDHKI